MVAVVTGQGLQQRSTETRRSEEVFVSYFAPLSSAVVALAVFPARTTTSYAHSHRRSSGGGVSATDVATYNQVPSVDKAGTASVGVMVEHSTMETPPPRPSSAIKKMQSEATTEIETVPANATRTQQK